MRALLVALLCAPTIADAGPCAVPTLGPHTLPASATTIASDGGVLVFLQPNYGEETGGDVTTWRFRDGKRLVKPAIVTLAPGLMTLALPATGGDPLVIENAAHAAQATVTRGGKANLLAAPRVRKASAQTVPGPRSSVTNEVLVDLIAAPPTEAAALVIFGIDNQTTTARSWAPVSHEQLSWVVYRSGGRCSVTLPGTLPSSAGDHVAFAWVDRSGRLSTMSAEVIVASP